MFCFEKKNVALYLSQEGEDTQSFLRRAEAYCKEHRFHLWIGEIFQEQEPHLALDWIREIMDAITIHTILVPSLEHLHATHMGYLLNFLIEAQEAKVKIVCLDPTPTLLQNFTLAVVPLTTELQAAGVVSLPEIVRCLRVR